MTDVSHPATQPGRPGGATDTAEQKARSLVEEQKNAAADRLSEVGRALEGAGEALEREVPAAAPFVRMATDGLRDASSALRGNDIDDLLDAVRGAARRYPIVFFGGTVLAGLALVRFLKSSAESRERARMDWEAASTTFDEDDGGYPSPYRTERSGTHG